MTITLKQIESILNKHHLLKEWVTPNEWHYSLPIEDQKLEHLTYDSRDISSNSLLFCKGIGFKEEFLVKAVQNGLNYYVSETPYEVNCHLGIIVTDIKKAMSVIAMAFYDNPQNELTLIGFTGTKGKTTSAYFTKFILDETTDHKTALLSTMNTTLDGVHYFKSELTTPESLDLFKMMREACDNGMSHLIMEVSSQAYKVQRVYNLTFDIGIFLNISPDHISAIEHPTFDDYFYCKRQLLLNSKKVVLFNESDYAQLLEEVTQTKQIPLITYSSHEDNADYYWEDVSETNSSLFSVKSNSETEESQKIIGEYHINLKGDFNKDNALSSIIVATLAGASHEDSVRGLEKATVPGRMEHLVTQNDIHLYIDYAHNYLSVKSLLSFAQKEHPDGKIITVLGSPGNKANSRRQDFGRVLSEHTNTVVLTADDPDREDPQNIANEISAAITNSNVKQFFEMDRKTAIEFAVSQAKPGDVVVIAGKGEDAYQRINGKSSPYPGDHIIARSLI